MSTKNLDGLCLPPLPPLPLASSESFSHHHNPYDSISSYQMTPDLNQNTHLNNGNCRNNNNNNSSNNNSGGAASGNLGSANGNHADGLRPNNLLSLTPYSNGEMYGDSQQHGSRNNSNNNNNVDLSSPSSKNDEPGHRSSIMNNSAQHSNDRRHQDSSLQQHSTGRYTPSLSYNGAHGHHHSSNYQGHLQPANGSNNSNANIAALRVSSAGEFNSSGSNGCQSALGGVQSAGIPGGSPLSHPHFATFNFSQAAGHQHTYHQSLGSANPFHPHHNHHQAGLVPQLLIPNHHHHPSLHHHHHPGLSVGGGPCPTTPSGGHLSMVADPLMVGSGVLTGGGMIGGVLGGLVGAGSANGGPNSANGSNLPSDCDTRELEAFAEHFKQRRIKIGVTQADVGSALGKLKIPGVGSLSQSTICRFESLTLSHNNMVALKPVLQAWLEEAEKSARETRLRTELFGSNGASILTDKKRKRTSIAAPEKRSLEAYFAIQPRPSGEKIAQIADKLDLKKNVVRVWFCNQRQKQKRMKFSAAGIQGSH